MARSCRGEIFEFDTVGIYHCVNRCVRRAFLCGADPLTGCNYEHRRGWIRQRLEFLAGSFGLDVMAFAILSNQVHLVLRNRPDVVARWSDLEVARRWYRLCPVRKQEDGSPKEPNRYELAMLTGDPERMAELRRRLSHPSWLMKMLCENIARRSNREDECTGRFFEGRYKMTRLLDEGAVLACMAYVDLNPIRAGLTDTLDGYRHVSIRDRLESLDDSPVDPAGWLAPIKLQSVTSMEDVLSVRQEGPNNQEGETSGQQTEFAMESDVASSETAAGTARRPSNRGCLPMELDEYIRLLTWLASAERLCSEKCCTGSPLPTPRGMNIDARAFRAVVDNFGRLFRTVAGNPQRTRHEAIRHGRHWLQSPGASQLEVAASPID